MGLQPRALVSRVTAGQGFVPKGGFLQRQARTTVHGLWRVAKWYCVTETIGDTFVQCSSRGRVSVLVLRGPLPPSSRSPEGEVQNVRLYDYLRVLRQPRRFLLEEVSGPCDRIKWWWPPSRVPVIPGIAPEPPY